MPTIWVLEHFNIVQEQGGNILFESPTPAEDGTFAELEEPPAIWTEQTETGSGTGSG